VDLAKDPFAGNFWKNPRRPTPIFNIFKAFRDTYAGNPDYRSLRPGRLMENEFFGPFDTQRLTKYCAGFWV